jgi:hypothetical protein
VLATWAASPARFREDANAEEALSRGYTDRVLVELAANAVDAARAAGVPAKIRIGVSRNDADGSGGELRVANTGAPLTPDGVIALASLRASAKRVDLASVGHFGVGFTAVLALSDAPRVISGTGGVEFSAKRTVESVAAQRDERLDVELELRRGVVPTLRLCWPAGDRQGPPAGYTTEVRLPCRADVEVDALLARWRRDVTDHLFWALPDLVEVAFDDRIVIRRPAGPNRVELVESVAGQPDRVSGFTVVSATGELPEPLLRHLPVEQQLRIGWRVGWVLPDQALDLPAALCAPTPTEELLSFPARLIGTFEVDETRRHLTDGSLDAFVLERAARTYLQLVQAVNPGRRWQLVPPNDFPAGPVDGRLRTAVLADWQRQPLLVGALGDPLTPTDAVSLPGVSGDAVAQLAEAVPGLLPAGSAAESAARRVLGVRELAVSEAVDALASVVRPPEFWRRLYDGLAEFDTDALGGLPVPLTDGRQVIGARGLLLPTADTGPLAVRAARVLSGLRIVHPAAAHPLLERLGAQPADPDALLGSDALREEIARCATDLDDGAIEPEALSYGAVDAAIADTEAVPAGDERADLGPGSVAGPAAVAALVLDLIDAGARPDPDVIGELVLSDTEGEPWPAGGLLLPDSPWRSLIDSDDLPTAHRLWPARWSAEVLARAGVRPGLLVIAADDPRSADLLPDLSDWLDDPATDDAIATDAPAIADLDLFDDDDWPAVLTLLAADQAARAAVLDVRAGAGYSAWWLRRNVRFNGRSPAEFRLPSAADLAGLYDPLPPSAGELDTAVAAAIGVLTDLDAAATTDPQRLLDRFCDPARRLHPTTVAALTRRIVALQAEHPELALPAAVRTLAGTAVDADLAAVPDGPWWAATASPEQLVAPGGDASATAGALDLLLASARWPVQIESGESAEPAVAERLSRDVETVRLALGIDDPLPSLRPQPGLTIRFIGDRPDRSSPRMRVGWWPAADGYLVDDDAEAIADALAWAAGRYDDRHLARSALHGTAGLVAVEVAFDRRSALPEGPSVS